MSKKDLTLIDKVLYWAFWLYMTALITLIVGLFYLWFLKPYFNG